MWLRIVLVASISTRHFDSIFDLHNAMVVRVIWEFRVALWHVRDAFGGFNGF